MTTTNPISDARLDELHAKASVIALTQGGHYHEGVLAALTELRAIRQRPADAALREAQALVTQLDEVHSDSRYVGIWTCALVHGMRYEGPTYTDQLEALRTALASSPPPEPQPRAIAERDKLAADLKRAEQDRDGYASEIADRDFVAPAFEENARSSVESRTSAGMPERAAAPATSEARAAEVEAWRKRVTERYDNTRNFLLDAGQLDEALRLMRSPPPSPAPDGRLAMLMAWLLKWIKEAKAANERHPTSELYAKGYRDGISWGCETVRREIDRLDATPASAPSGDAKLRALRGELELEDWTDLLPGECWDRCSAAIDRLLLPPGNAAPGCAS